MTLVKLVDRSENSYQRFQPSAPTHRSLSKVKLQQVHSIFQLMDTNQDGLLIGEEITHTGRLLGLQLQVPREEDSESAPSATFEQFGALVADAMHRDHNSVDDLSYETSKLFASVDKFGKGVITPDSLMQFFTSIGDQVPQELVHAMMDAMDSDLEGTEVTEAELKSFLGTASARARQPTVLRMPRSPFSLYTSMLQSLLDTGIAAATERPTSEKPDMLFNMVELRSALGKPPRDEAAGSAAGAAHAEDGNDDGDDVAGTSREGAAEGAGAGTQGVDEGPGRGDEGASRASGSGEDGEEAGEEEEKAESDKLMAERSSASPEADDSDDSDEE
eukprot:jgi/Tetstr1/463389/TSEL_008311.t1